MNNLKKGSFASFVLVLEQGAIKIVGLVSTMILARLIMPEDFGIIAIALLVMGLIEHFADLGSGQYLLSLKQINNDKVNTDWTINFILKSVVSIFLFISAFIAADFYDDQRLINLIIALTFIFFAYNFINPGLIYLRREQEYGKIVKLTLIKKLVTVAATVVSALILQNYWALVIGRAAGCIAQIIGSYMIFPYIPRFKLDNPQEQWSFSGWMIPQSLFGYVRTQLDSFLVSSTYGQAALGAYQTTKYIAYIPIESLLGPVTGPFMTELVKARIDKEYFNKQYNASLLVVLILAAPLTCIMYFNHNEIVLLLLGKNWIEFSYLFGVFSFLLIAYVLQQHGCRVMMVYGRTREIFIFQLISFFIVFTPLVFIDKIQLNTFLYIRVAGEMVMSFGILTIASIYYTGHLNTLKLFGAITPIAFSSFVASWAMSATKPVDSNALLTLITSSVVYITTFTASILMLHFLILKKTRDWNYIETLITKLFISLKNK